jgi:hypothetical protein
LDEDVRAPLVLDALDPLNPDPHALSVSVAAIAIAPPTNHLLVLLCIFSPWCGVPEIRAQ